MPKRGVCLLCRVELEALPGSDVQRHPETDDCAVRYTDAWGIALSDEQVALVQQTPVDPDLAPLDALLFNRYPPVERFLEQWFTARGVPRLGGRSSGRGWSSFALWQRCPFAWRQRYLRDARPMAFIENASLAIGTLVHVFLALHYEAMISGSVYAGLTPEALHAPLLDTANPELVNEAWRIFKAYRLWYSQEEIQPLATEYDLRDPRTGESCRYDGVMFFPKPLGNRPAGTYIMEHKTFKIFDMNTLEGWANDGEVIGQVSLWKRLGLDKRFGPLRGVIVNLLGKHKEPKFHRTIVAPESILIDAHRQDLRQWEGLIQLAISTDTFPRSRNNCIGRFGRCEWWDECLIGA